MAILKAAAIPTSSMTEGSMWQVPTATATSAIWAASSSRRAGVSCFESLMPRIWGSSGKATAHTVSGPAIEPRPTSSTPRTMPCPPSSRISEYMPATRPRSASARASRPRAAETAFWTCFRGSPS